MANIDNYIQFENIPYEMLPKSLLEHYGVPVPVEQEQVEVEVEQEQEQEQVEQEFEFEFPKNYIQFEDIPYEMLPKSLQQKQKK